MKISELAKRTNISTHRLRRYEALGLIKSTRSKNSYREFSESVVREAIVSELKQAKGRGEVFNSQRLKDKIEVIGPVVGLEELTRSIYVESVDRLGETWDEWYGRLMKFIERVGHCKVPQSYIQDGFKLGLWVTSQRSNKNEMAINRINKLNQIRFIWDPIEYQWDAGYSALLNFYKREGHCKVNSNFTEDGYKLGHWVANQRAFKDRLSEEKIEKLNFINFVWDPISEQWEKGYSALFKFWLREKNCKVKKNYIEDGYNLGNWVSLQRNNLKILNQDKIDRLNKIGFIWDAINEKWEFGFTELSKFKEIEGHCKVPDKLIFNNFRLGQWVGVQRQNYSDLSDERKLRLNEIGFIWNIIDSQWEEGYSALCSYFKENGNSLVPIKFIQNGYRLGQWVAVQRQTKEKLSLAKKNKLDRLNFIWDPRTNLWDDSFDSLQKFIVREKNFLIPSKKIENDIDISSWVINQRMKKHLLTTEQINRLNQLNFPWDPRENKWILAYSKLCEFNKREGHSRVPQSHMEGEFRLGTWVANIRTRKSDLTKDRIDQLNKIDFIWDLKKLNKLNS